MPATVLDDRNVERRYKYRKIKGLQVAVSAGLFVYLGYRPSPREFRVRIALGGVFHIASYQNDEITMEILRDKHGKPQGIIREIAGGQERFYDRAGHAIATYHPNTNYTYDNNGPCWLGQSTAGTCQR